MSIDTARFLAAIAESQPPTPPHTRIGTTTVDSSVPSAIVVSLTFDGEDTETAETFFFLDSYNPIDGDRVLCHRVGGTWVIFGNLTDAVDSAAFVADAAFVAFTPTGTISSTNVQAAIAEVASEAGNLSAHLSDTVDAHDASAVSYLPTGTIASTDVQAAIAEASGDLTTHAAAADPHPVYLKVIDGTAVPDDEASPSTPTGFAMYPSFDAMTVTWANAPGGEVDMVNGYGQYQVQIDTVNTFNSTGGNPLYDLRSQGNAMTVLNLDVNTLYYGRVRAIDAHGNQSSYASTVSATTLLVDPSVINIDSMIADGYLKSSTWDGGAGYATGPGTAGWVIDDDGIEANEFRARGELEASRITQTEGADLLGLNGTFESGYAGAWVAQSSTVAHSGTYSGRLTASGADMSSNFMTIVDPNPSEDTVYRLAGWWRAGTTGLVGFIGGMITDLPPHQWQTSTKFPNTTTWYPFSVEAFVPAGEDLFLFLGTPAAVGQFLYIDDVTCRPVGSLIGSWTATSDLFVYGRDEVVHSVDKPGVEAWRDTTQSITTSTNTSIVWNIANRDEWDMLASTSTARIYVPESGWYALASSIEWDTNTTGTRIATLRKNGVNGAGTTLQRTRVPATASVTQSLAANVYLSAGDYVVTDVFQNSGTTRTVEPFSTYSPTMQVVKLS